MLKFTFKIITTGLGKYKKTLNTLTNYKMTTLSDDALLEILSYLDPRNLVKIEQVSKYFQRLVADEFQRRTELVQHGLVLLVI